MIDKGIPIRNIFHMLCYAWDYIDPDDEKEHDWESMNNLDDLLCTLIISGVDRLRKRGFHKSYHPDSGELSTIRGRVNILESSKPKTKINKRVVCEYDEYDSDNQFNRILLSTTLSMHKYTDENKIRKELARQIPYYNNITPITITLDSFNSLIYDRNNATYRLLMNICELYWSNKMSNESEGKHRFIDFNDDERMAKIYEKFLLNFYTKNRKDLSVKVDRFGWKLAGNINYPEGLEYLLTDVVIKDNKQKKMLIIDAKYYRDTLISRYERDSVRNTHIAQVYAYMRNHPDAKDYATQGMLIYPQSGTEVHSTFPLEDGTITAHTINLDKNWELIEEELLSYLDVLDS